MADNWKNPYKDMKFDSKPFDTEITKVRESFDSTIQDAGMAAGMASGMNGMNVNRVTADTYARAMGQRDSTMGQLEGQKAQAITQFNSQKQQLMAQAEDEYQKTKPGFMDWLSAGVGMATSIVSLNPFGILGSAGKMGGLIGGGMNKPNIGPKSVGQAGPDMTQIQTTVTDPIKEFQSKTIDPNGNQFKIKPRTKSKQTSFFSQPQVNWGYTG